MVTRRLTPAELADWQALFDNAKKMRTLLAELQELTLTIAGSQPARRPITRNPAKPRGHSPLNPWAAPRLRRERPAHRQM
jgi:hypothetical protein